MPAPSMPDYFNNFFLKVINRRSTSVVNNCLNLPLKKKQTRKEKQATRRQKQLAFET